MGVGRCSTGATVSRTRTTKPAVVVWPAPSVASQRTVVSPSGNSAGVAGDAAGAHSTGSGPLTASVATTSKPTSTPSALVASAVIPPAGTASTGGPSTTVT